MDPSFNSFVAAQQKPGSTNGTVVPGTEVVPPSTAVPAMPVNGQAGEVGAAFPPAMPASGGESQNRTLWYGTHCVTSSILLDRA